MYRNQCKVPRARAPRPNAHYNTAYQKLEDWDGTEPLPKNFMRQAAILGWKTLGEDAAAREDINVGLRYIKSLLQVDKSTHDLLGKVEDRGMNRGARPIISRDDQLMLASLLFQSASEKIVPSKRSILDKWTSPGLLGTPHAKDVRK